MNGMPLFVGTYDWRFIALPTGIAILASYVALDFAERVATAMGSARCAWLPADVKTNFAAALPSVSCYPGKSNRVILNLVVKTAHAIADVVHNGGPAKGKINVETGNTRARTENRIQDTGSSFPEEIRTRIFDLFFTTKEIGKGTGQSFSIARSVVVNKHGATIHLETETGKGTTSVLRLPRDGKSCVTKAVAA